VHCLINILSLFVINITVAKSAMIVSAIILDYGWVEGEYGTAGGCVTDVMLHSSQCYHQVVALPMAATVTEDHALISMYTTRVSAELPIRKKSSVLGKTK
jgi:hypothetical protein